MKNIGRIRLTGEFWRSYISLLNCNTFINTSPLPPALLVKSITFDFLQLETRLESVDRVILHGMRKKDSASDSALLKLNRYSIRNLRGSIYRHWICLFNIRYFLCVLTIKINFHTDDRIGSVQVWIDHLISIVIGSTTFACPTQVSSSNCLSLIRVFRLLLIN